MHVEIPSDPADPLKLLATGKVDAAISYEPEVLLARNQGQPLVSVARSSRSRSPRSCRSAPSTSRSPSQLRGKRVGDAGIPYQHAYLETILARAGVPASSVKEINVGDNLVPAMLSGRVDATLGAFWNYEAIQLAQLHKHPNVIHDGGRRRPHLRRAGPGRAQEHDRQPSRLRSAGSCRRSRVATSRPGANPQVAVANLVHASPGLDPKLQLASVRATLPAFFRPIPRIPGAGRARRNGTRTASGCSATT